MNNENQISDQQALALIKNIPNLHNMDCAVSGLSSTYWTPTEKGECKRVVISEITIDTYIKQGKEVQLECIVMIEQAEDGALRTIKNGSMILVDSIKKALESGTVQYLQTPLQIQFDGKKATNSGKNVDLWIINPLIARNPEA